MEMDDSKPFYLHCAGGYRSAAGASIIQPYTSEVVFDLSDEITSIKHASLKVAYLTIKIISFASAFSHANPSRTGFFFNLLTTR
jgi:hypothetical protein